jgi:hypothetical protein
MKQLNLEKLNEFELLSIIASSGLFIANTTSDMMENFDNRKVVMDAWFKVLTTLEVIKKAVETVSEGDLLKQRQD